MPDLVRVRDNGFEYNTGRANAETKGLDVLDEPVRDRTGVLRPRTRVDGRPAGRKAKTSVDAEAAKKSSAAKKAAAKKAEAAPAPADSTAIKTPSEEN